MDTKTRIQKSEKGLNRNQMCLKMNLKQTKNVQETTKNYSKLLFFISVGLGQLFGQFSLGWYFSNSLFLHFFVIFRPLSVQF